MPQREYKRPSKAAAQRRAYKASPPPPTICPFPSHRAEALDWGLLVARVVRCGSCHPDPAREWAEFEAALGRISRPSPEEIVC